ncbi:hypothetical protein A3O16_07405 [Ligilactobacillus aviarius]|uniref:restriction endonuclease subunit S n=1 Tax=Ligilactobacillus aviarius TaxID=1606 RepID=UPI0007E09FD1|nr:restriction endonuclease subunit S [Ligilactobacillus aviarius]OAP99554.1 hypothetical protein A3O08_00240 [Ligilactobacillus aviarius]OAQ01765.1 hypothetical protein A3O09_01330 [Ligilactobacillus aviarius]OAS75318.1 hypothetical protein A3O16_07405 [Ligilactobacillus aviarius]OAS79615.1 hypothetical protein A3O19_04930 [Ligilactobacillus aviarius]
MTITSRNENFWEQRELGQLMEIGSVKRIHMNEWKNTGVPFFRARDIVAKFNNKKISDSIYISEETYNSNILKSGKVKKGQLLITGVGTIGIPYLITDDSPLYFKDGNVIWLKNNNYDGNFIFYFFTTNLFKNYLFKITGTGTVGTYTIENAKKTPISTPQINEQIKIGKLFNILENLLALYDRKLKLLSQVKKYFLDNLFVEKEYPNLRFKGFTDAWEQRKLGEIFKFSQGLQVPIDQQLEKKEENTERFIRIVDVTQDNIPQRFVYNPTGKGRVNLDDIFFVRYGAVGTIGHGFKGVIANNLFKVIPLIDINPLFWFYQFSDIRFNSRLKALSASTSMPAINFNTLRKMIISNTSIVEQNKIGTILKSLDNLLTLYENEQQHLTEIKKTLLNTMFI